ncbi:MAG TPA: fused MFS/spermidine synthase, partial [Terriglobales bacterium]|nr:fused MFS/spermidine synthase [Terriglobales bacterium]
EINPLVEPIARNFFTYVRDSAASIQVVPGDARVSLASEPPQGYDVLVVDAFSGDAIPVHLLTREAFQLYQRHLSPGGILAVHVSNRYLDLVPVVRQQAQYAGLPALLVTTEDDDDVQSYGSTWVLVTANRDFLADKAVESASQSFGPSPPLRLWTDDYNSLLPLLKKPEPDDD